MTRTQTAHRRLPDRDGFCPVLEPGDYCRDKISGIWHFRAPDGSRFALDETPRRGQLVEQHNDSVTTILVPPSFCHLNDEVVDNPWTITDGEWARKKK